MGGPPHSVMLVKGNYGRAGGPETLIATILRGLDPARIRAVLVVLKRPGISGDPLLDDGRFAAAWREIPWRGLLAAPHAARALSRLSRVEGAELISTHDMRSNLAAFLVTRSRRLPWVCHAHGWLGPTHRGRWRVYEAIDRRLVRFADVVVVGSQESMREVEALGARRVAVLPNAIQPPPPGTGQGDALRIRERCRVPPGAVLVGVVGRLHPGKGQRLVVEALARLRGKGLEVRGLFVGEGPDFEPLSALVAGLGLGEVVTFAGFQEDLVPYLAAMDIVAVPSLKETGPLTVLEALAVRRPVIASRVGFTPEVIGDGINGFCVPPGDAGAFDRALERLVRDPALRTALGSRAMDVAPERFSVEAMLRTVEGIYEDVLRAPRPARI